ncbi:hypothetical protein LTS08_001589 [Lithohypha guttulata]|nr:hypothetical protein LTS08_001589 [Lithohypha guttulata]
MTCWVACAIKPARTIPRTSFVYLSTLTNIPQLSTSTTTSPTSSTPTATSIPAVASGLSTGATAGVAVGVTLVVVALALAGFLFWRRSKKQKKKVTAAAALAPTPRATSPPPETKEVVPKNDHRLSQAVSEMPGSPRTPISPDFKGNTSVAGQPSPGLPRYSQVYEMPANTNERPLSYPPTELSSERGGWR